MRVKTAGGFAPFTTCSQEIWTMQVKAVVQSLTQQGTIRTQTTCMKRDDAVIRNHHIHAISQCQSSTVVFFFFPFLHLSVEIQASIYDSLTILFLVEVLLCLVHTGEFPVVTLSCFLHHSFGPLLDPQEWKTFWHRNMAAMMSYMMRMIFRFIFR